MSLPLIFQGSRAVLTCGVEIYDSLKLALKLLIKTLARSAKARYALRHDDDSNFKLPHLHHQLPHLPDDGDVLLLYDVMVQ